MPQTYKITNCHNKLYYRQFSLTNHLLSPSYFYTNLINIGDKTPPKLIMLPGTALYPLRLHNHTGKVFVFLQME